MLDAYEPDVRQGNYIRVHTDSSLNTLTARFPNASENLRRIIFVAASMASGRIPEKPMLADVAALAWMIEGGRHIRVHKGFLYIYNDDGSFLPFTGIPSEAVLHRVSFFFNVLEGVFRRLRDTVRKEADALANAIMADRQNFASDDDFFASCTSAAARRPGNIDVDARLDNPEGEDGDLDHMQENNNGGSSSSWMQDLADRSFKLSFALKQQFMHTRMVALIVEWCETEDERRPAICYEDICFAYDLADRSSPVERVVKGSANNCYVHVPHPLLDPVMRSNEERLERFYTQTFWANHNVFLACQAALALAKRGLNVDRCFIAISPGGVGQSLYSQHLAEMYKHNHAFFDPNIWHQEEELRKQIESFARCFIITGQEAPESSKKLHTDLYKKTMSADGIMGRKPYGYTTRMFSVTGWKRLEVNRIMAFLGVTLENFNSMLRRGFIWKPMARFVHKQFLKNYPDHEKDGIFESDPTLSKFLATSQASIAGLRLQWAFEESHSKDTCYQLIEDYANGGDRYLTEDTLRTACGLPVRQRHEQAEAGLAAVVNVDEGNDKNADDKESSWQHLLEFWLRKMSDSCIETLTYHTFKNTSMKDVQVPNFPKDQLWDQLQQEELFVEALVKHKTSKKKAGALIPKFKFKTQLHDICKKNADAQQMTFTEEHDIAKLKEYAFQHVSRARNADTLRSFFQQCLKPSSTTKAGRKTAADASNVKAIKESLNKLNSHENTINKLAAVSESVRRQKRRLMGKTSEEKQLADDASPTRVSKEVQYHYSNDLQFSVRARRYSEAYAAQSMSRRLQSPVVEGHTVDLDICNCCVSIVHQVIAKLQPTPALPTDLQTFLDDLARSRQTVIRRLGLTTSQGKQLINKMLNGGAAPDSLKDNEDIKKLQRLSLYLRWIACNVLHADYLSLADVASKTFPSATIFSLMWTCIEDWILDVWTSHISHARPAHISLHFDGVRVSADVAPDLGEFIDGCRKHILDVTGFDVEIARKQPQTVFQCIRDAVKSDAGARQVPDLLCREGHCIPCAMWHAFGGIRSGVETIVEEDARRSNRTPAKISQVWCACRRSRDFLVQLCGTASGPREDFPFACRKQRQTTLCCSANEY